MPPLSARLSPALQVVTAAVQKAGRRLLRDFGEVEQLQTNHSSLKCSLLRLLQGK